MRKNLKLSIRYIVPSVASMLASSLYTVVDGIFVGRGVGANALAAVNVALPFTMVAMIVTTMVTIGSATVFAIRVGRGDDEKALDVFMHGQFVLLWLMAALSLLGVLLPEQIARLSGASDLLLADTAVYIRYIGIFNLFSRIMTIS